MLKGDSTEEDIDYYQETQKRKVLEKRIERARRTEQKKKSYKLIRNMKMVVIW